MARFCREAVALLAFSTGAHASSTKDCLVNTGTSAAGCQCTDMTGNATCVNLHCHCHAGGCAGDDGKCHAGVTNAQVGGAGQVYRIRNARWPNWYMESRSDSASLYVGKGEDRASARTYQWTLMTPPSTDSSLLTMMMTVYRPEHAITFGTKRVCSVVINGTELELDDNVTRSGQEIEILEPGPEGLPVEGLGFNGETLEPVEENETARLLDSQSNTSDDPNGEWYEDSEEEELLSSLVYREPLSYRSRYSSYYSRSRYSSYYSRSRDVSYYSRSRSYYSRSRSYYSSYYSSYGGYNSDRRRSYCRDVLVGNAVKVTGSTSSVDQLTMKLEQAPVSSGDARVPLFMIQSAKYGGRYLHVAKFSSSVDIHTGDPGAGGYWFLDPPPPNSFTNGAQSFQGTKCSWWCGGVGDVSDVGLMYVNQAHSTCVPLFGFLFATVAAVSNQR